jgi:hypothetical protein
VCNQEVAAPQLGIAHPKNRAQKVKIEGKLKNVNE